MKRSQRNAPTRVGMNGDYDDEDFDDGRRPQRQSSRRNVKVDFSRCEIASLHKYRKFHKLEGSPNTTKDELIAIIAKHFAAQPTPSDEEAIAAFLLCFKRVKQARPPAQVAKRGRGGGGPNKGVR